MSTCPTCGAAPARPPKPRSVPAHRRYFAMIAGAFDYWPQNHEFQPASVDHLRKWLQTRAGHFDATEISLAGMSPAAAVAATVAAMSRQPHCFVKARGDGDGLVVYRPRSIAFAKLTREQALALHQAVEEILRAEIGFDPEAARIAAHADSPLRFADELARKSITMGSP